MASTETSTDAASVFQTVDGNLVPSAHASGPWDPQALHGGAPAALIASAFEAMEPGSQLPVGSLSVQLLRPIPSAPLTLSTEIVRPGRRVQELAAQIRCDGALVCRAKALRVQPVPDGASSAPPDCGPMPGPESGTPVHFALDDPRRTSFASTAMEMRWLSEPWTLGPGRVWMRLRRPLLDDRPASALARLAATADFGNGISAELPFETHLFINADLGIHLWRPPRGEWIGIDARTVLRAGGSGLAESVLHDLDGPLGRGFQTLVVQPRKP